MSDKCDICGNLFSELQLVHKVTVPEVGAEFTLCITCAEPLQAFNCTNKSENTTIKTI